MAEGLSGFSGQQCQPSGTKLAPLQSRLPDDGVKGILPLSAEEPVFKTGLGPPVWMENPDVILDGSALQVQASGSFLSGNAEKQKLMEEENNLRKVAISRAIETGIRRSLEEREKLDRVQAEFGKIDQVISRDVEVLRHRIEEAGLECTEAKHDAHSHFRRKFSKAEEEFAKAKTVLMNAQRKKADLIKSLNKIVEANAQRKAEKLNSLMNELGIKL